jgi:hypothetical protein
LLYLQRKRDRCRCQGDNVHIDALFMQHDFGLFQLPFMLLNSNSDYRSFHSRSFSRYYQMVTTALPHTETSALLLSSNADEGSGNRATEVIKHRYRSGQCIRKQPQPSASKIWSSTQEDKARTELNPGILLRYSVQR